jgi:integrase
MIMHLVAYANPLMSDKNTLTNLRLFCLLNQHQIVKANIDDQDIYDVWAQAKNADGLIVPSLEHITRGWDFVTGIEELRKVGKHLICVEDSINTTIPASDAVLRTLRQVYQPVTSKRFLPDSKKPTPTLNQVLAEYKKFRKLSDTSKSIYSRHLTNCFSDWLDRPITFINRENIQDRHREITLKRGPSLANAAMKILRALLNFASHRYETDKGDLLVKANPVRTLSGLGAWNKETPRTNFIRKHQLAKWFMCCQSLQDETLRDLFLFLILTGCRKSEASGLRWATVDFESQEFTFLKTKNGTDFTLPMTTQTFGLLSRRYARQQGSPFVFEHPHDEARPFFLNMQYQVFLKAGLKCSHHDLRRTFCAVADLIDIEDALIRRLTNHKDVTVMKHYLSPDAERFRVPLQKINDAFFSFFLLDSPKIVHVMQLDDTLALLEVVQ